ncbi:MAG: penicillin acylase family protein [SAR202 cluster bacterium]|nr:penicillin acylase family protein [SAR202 cluster bacterium]
MNVARLLFRAALGTRLPVTSGAISVSGLSGEVRVRRDSYGIPYIEAETDDDAWYGVGFCQGQDRAFKLEGLLRVANGTLSDMVGPQGLPVDRLSRRIGFRRSAAAQLAAFSPEVRSKVAAFARGVTDGARLGAKRPAHEFALVRSLPSPFAAEDIVAIYLLQCFALAANWDLELARLRILKEDGPEALLALDPAYPADHPVTSPPGAVAGETIGRLEADLKAYAELVGTGGASNNWAISPARTSSGEAVLANDPHLLPVLPPHWYLAHVRTPRWAMCGALLTGLPVFAIGHNGHVAWGVTLGLADNTDLFIEEVGPDGASVREGDRFAPCRVARETIMVKGQAEVLEEVLITPRGPVVGPAIMPDAGALSLKALWLQAAPVNGFLGAHQARTAREFRELFRDWPHLSLNVVFADDKGAIGWQLAGAVPARRKGHGTMPQAGWDAGAGWESDPVDFDRMPYLLDPPEGFVATANNQPQPSAAEPFLGIDWIEGYRIARIRQILESRTGWDVSAAMQAQMDRVSLPWGEIKEHVLAAPVSTPRARRAVSVLRTWDGVVSADSPGAAVFELFLAEMTARTATAKAPRTWKRALGKGDSAVVPWSIFSARRVGHLAKLLKTQPTGWFDRTWPQEVAEALEAVTVRLEATHGPDPSGWAWGRVRRLTLRHPVGERAGLGRVFNLGPFPIPGDTNTVAQAAVDPIDPAANPIVVPSLRMAVEVGNWESCRFSMPGGQSGNPLSPHYSDLLEFWKKGEGVPIAWSPENIDRAAKSTLVLSPEAS